MILWFYGLDANVLQFSRQCLLLLGVVLKSTVPKICCISESTKLQKKTKNNGVIWIFFRLWLPHQRAMLFSFPILIIVPLLVVHRIWCQHHWRYFSVTLKEVRMVPSDAYKRSIHRNNISNSGVDCCKTRRFHWGSIASNYRYTYRSWICMYSFKM